MNSSKNFRLSTKNIGTFTSTGRRIHNLRGRNALAKTKDLLISDNFFLGTMFQFQSNNSYAVRRNFIVIDHQLQLISLNDYNL